MRFTDVTLAARTVASIRTHDTATLEPAAVAIFRQLLAAGRLTFPVPAPPDLGAITCTVAESPTCAVADFAVDGVLYTRSALLRDGCDGPPAWCASVTLPTARPLLATLVVASAAASGEAAAVAGWNPEAMAMIADMETCLAAAYFLRGSAARRCV